MITETIIVACVSALGGAISVIYTTRANAKKNSADAGELLTRAGAELAKSAMEQVRAMDERLAIAETHIEACNEDRRQMRQLIEDSHSDRTRLRSAIECLIAAVKANGHADIKAKAIANAEIVMQD